MKSNQTELWNRFKKYHRSFPELDLTIDVSRMHLDDAFLNKLQPSMNTAFSAMEELEKGAIANPDENRMVGHYWLRTPELAPNDEIRKEIESTVSDIKQFAQEVHSGNIQGQNGAFAHLLIIGIGGSALGPQFVSNALSQPGRDKLSLHFFDNTDPDGMDRTLTQLEGKLGRTLCVVISKSGGTKETRNGMLEAEHAYEEANLAFGSHTVAITSNGSQLDQYAIDNHWLKRFPMWDWVGGRTSELSAVGLLPAALQGFNIDLMLEGAKKCDEVTRNQICNDNPAALLAASWYWAGNGKGSKDMVVLPYKDRLELFSKYLQQLVMESLGKEFDLKGKVVNQGLAVYGNKGSTDQHAYVQQLIDGLPNFFVTFIQVLKERESKAISVEDNFTSGDYLFGFLMGTRTALTDKQRESVLITIKEVSEFSVGVLIALFERAVGLYASLIHINAYHQPGVEAGKKAAGELLALQQECRKFLTDRKNQKFTAEVLAKELGKPEMVESIYKILEHLTANSKGVVSDQPRVSVDSEFFAS